MGPQVPGLAQFNPVQIEKAIRPGPLFSHSQFFSSPAPDPSGPFHVESRSADILPKEGTMSLLKAVSLIMAAYLAAGRTGSVATCLYLGFEPLETLIIALFIDIVQIPVYGILLQASNRFLSLPRRFRAWIEERSRKIKERIEKGLYWKKLIPFQPLAIMAVSMIPFRGFGVFSACILAFIMGYRRLKSTLLIMCGSFVGALLTILIFFFPARWLSAL